MNKVSILMKTHILLLALCVGCAGNQKAISKKKISRKMLNQTMEYYGKVVLPFQYDLANAERLNAKEIRFNTNDTLFFRENDGLILGYLPDTTNFISFLRLMIASDYLPAITTFDKEGKKIDQGSICLGNCAGLGLDHEFCNESLFIDQNMNITTNYCSKLFIEAGENYELIDTVYNWQEGFGKITKDGKIDFWENDIQTDFNPSFCLKNE